MIAESNALGLEPYAFVRSVSIAMGTFWSLRGIVRLLRFGKRWEHRIYSMGLSRSWYRRQIMHLVLRTTICDPINVFLFVFLVSIWSIH